MVVASGPRPHDMRMIDVLWKGQSRAGAHQAERATVISAGRRSSVPKKSVRYANRDKYGGRQGYPKRYDLMPTHT